MVGQGEVREGLVVRDAQGRRVGHVGAVGESHFELERGLLPRREYRVDYAQVEWGPAGELVLERGATPEPLEDDDGGALPPRHGERLESEPVNE